jgi:hypothetical protein
MLSNDIADPDTGRKPVIAEQILQQQKTSRFVVVADDSLNPPAEGTECTLKHWAEFSPGFGLSMKGVAIIMSHHRLNKQIQRSVGCRLHHGRVLSWSRPSEERCRHL